MLRKKSEEERFRFAEAEPTQAIAVVGRQRRRLFSAAFLDEQKSGNKIKNGGKGLI
jgi:hypothetical protein